MSRRKTADEHRLNGTYKPHRAGNYAGNGVTFSGPAKMPTYLSKDARAEWRRIGPDLEQNGILTAASANIFAAYCTAFALWRECLADIGTNGQTIMVNSHTRTGSTTVPKQNPAVRNLGEHQRAMLAAAKLFGIDPLNRPRIEASPLPPAKRRVLPADSPHNNDHCKHEGDELDSPYCFDM